MYLISRLCCLIEDFVYYYINGKIKVLYLKEKGNQVFLKKNYILRLLYFSKYIQAEDNKESIYYSNKALFYYVLQKYQESYDNATEIYQMNEKNIIANSILRYLGKFKNRLETSKNSKSLTHIYKQIFELFVLCWLKQIKIRKKLDEKNKKAVEMTYAAGRKQIKTQKQLQEYIKQDDRLSISEKQTTFKQIDKFIINEKQTYEIPKYLRCGITQNYQSILGLQQSDHPMRDTNSLNQIFYNLIRIPNRYYSDQKKNGNQFYEYILEQEKQQQYFQRQTYEHLITSLIKVININKQIIDNDYNYKIIIQFTKRLQVKQIISSSFLINTFNSDRNF